MYLEHYGLQLKPFSKTPDPAFLFHSRQHAEALARLSHAIEEREVAVLTGEVGAGKTTLSRALVDAFADRCRFSFVINPALPPAQLLGAIAEGFGLPGGRRKSETWSALGQHLAALDEAGQFPVVVVDEAQLLSGRSAFDELRLLTNLAADDRPLVGLAQERLGIAVDDLVGQQDIVVKSLGRVLQGVRGIAGATDLGNRRTVLVLDVGAIIEDVVSGDDRAVREPDRDGARDAAG